MLSYFLGSVNFSIIITKIKKHDDIRKYGSGNAGFTNVLRCVGAKPAVVTFAGDLLKSVVAIVSAYYIMKLSDAPYEYAVMAKYAAGFFAVFGHTYPAFFGLKGGKGVVTSSGMLLCCDYRFLIICLSIFLITFIITRIISISSILACAAFPIATFVINYLSYSNGNMSLSLLVFSCVAAFLVGCLTIFRHRSNIKRLIRGEEKKISVKK